MVELELLLEQLVLVEEEVQVGLVLIMVPLQEEMVELEQLLQ
jgi:hypothetical protein